MSELNRERGKHIPAVGRALIRGKSVGGIERK